MRINKDGRHMKRTSIDLDERLIAIVKDRDLQLSGLVSKLLMRYLELSDLDYEIAQLKSMSEAIDDIREEDRWKKESNLAREVATISTLRDEDNESRKAVAVAQASAAAEKDRAEAHVRKLRDTWLVMVKKKKIIEGGLLRKLPENDHDLDHVEFWPKLARDLSAVAGEPYTEQEVIAYAKQQVARV